MATSRTMKTVVAGALVLAGFGAGAVVALTGSASAATDAVTGTVSGVAEKMDPTKSIRSDEHLFTGTTASKVEAAAREKYPNATIQRVETDSEGVYEAHVVTSAGEQVNVMVGKDFTVTSRGPSIHPQCGRRAPAPSGRGSPDQLRRDSTGFTGFAQAKQRLVVAQPPC